MNSAIINHYWTLQSRINTKIFCWFNCNLWWETVRIEWVKILISRWKKKKKISILSWPRSREFSAQRRSWRQVIRWDDRHRHRRPRHTMVYFRLLVGIYTPQMEWGAPLHQYILRISAWIIDRSDRAVMLDQVAGRPGPHYRRFCILGSVCSEAINRRLRSPGSRLPVRVVQPTSIGEFGMSRAAWLSADLPSCLTPRPCSE